MIQLKLQGIGIIDDAEIRIPGLTVITGKNSSGKSTVGKALYAAIEGGSRIPMKYDRDSRQKISTTLSDVNRMLPEFRSLIRMSNKSPEESRQVEKAFSQYPAFWKLIRASHPDRIDASEEEVEELAGELARLDTKALAGKLNEIRRHNGQASAALTGIEETADRVHEAAKRVQELADSLGSVPDYQSYTAESIDSLLQREFKGQIQPVAWEAGHSVIQLTADGSSKDNKRSTIRIEEIGIDSNRVSAVSPVRIDSFFDRAIMIDDPMVIDALDEENDYSGYESADDPYQKAAGNHREALIRLIKSGRNRTILEQTEIRRRNSEVSGKLGQMVSGNFILEGNGSYLVSGKGKKLRISNLATGAKTAALIMMLLDEGLITKDTVLILDEPESHLHPEWQNMFAEVIMLIMLTIGTKVVMTTHSPNFFYALDTYAQKYAAADKCAFYQARCLENGHAVIEDVSGDVGRIYSDFLDYMVRMREIREDLKTERDKG